MADFIKTTDLQSKPTAGIVGTPQFNTDGDSFGKVMTADTTNSDAAQINITASEENLAKKYKNPNVKQDVEPAGNSQYEY